MKKGKDSSVACGMGLLTKTEAPTQKISINTLTSWVIIKPREKVIPIVKPLEKECQTGLDPLASPIKRSKHEAGKPIPRSSEGVRLPPIDLKCAANGLTIREIFSLANPDPTVALPKKRVVSEGTSISSPIANDSIQPEEYEVEIILAKKGTGVVKWKGYDISESSWEPAKNLSCRELVVAFEECIRELPEKPLVQYDPAIEGIISNVANVRWLPKNISDFLILVNKDIGPSISVVNTIDADGPPEGFIYIAKSVRGEEVPPIDPAFIAGCNCKGSCHAGKLSKCACLKLTYGIQPYDKDGILQLPPKHAIQECSVNCKCPPTCPNRLIQRGRTVKLQIFKTAKKGWGVRAMEKIPKGRFVAEYVGEIITSEEAERRGLEYDSRGLTYLFDLDFNYGQDEDCPFSIDAYKYGNVTHFINHSCDPNIAVYTALYESPNDDIHNLAFFAVKDIAKYEELCFDYAGGVEEIESKSLVEKMNQVSLSEKSSKYPCHCGADNCRKFVHIY